MGSELLTGLIEMEIAKGIQPDFFKARLWLKQMELIDCFRSVNSAFGREVGIPDDAEFKAMSEEAQYDAIHVCIDELGGDPRGRIEKAIMHVEMGWNSQHRMMNRLTGKFTEILIAGDISGGDSVESVDDLVLFVESNCAKAAGFLV